MIFGRNGWIASRNACPGCTSAWISIKGSSVGVDCGCVEVRGPQRDEEERRRGVDHHQQQLFVSQIVTKTLAFILATIFLI